MLAGPTSGATLGLPLSTRIPWDMVYLCRLGVLELPLGLPGATSEYLNSWGYGISGGATSGATSEYWNSWGCGISMLAGATGVGLLLGAGIARDMVYLCWLEAVGPAMEVLYPLCLVRDLMVEPSVQLLGVALMVTAVKHTYRVELVPKQEAP